MGIVGKAHVGVCVADVDEAIAWYLDVLEMTVPSPPYLTDPGIRHIGLVCDDLAATRADLEGRGVSFLTSDHSGADIAGLRTTWFRDPYGVVFAPIEKSDSTRPYWRQPRRRS